PAALAHGRSPLSLHDALPICFAALAAGWPCAAGAQDWPTKAVKIVVAFGPGGTADILARIVAAELSSAFKQQFIVENKPGNSGADRKSTRLNSSHQIISYAVF